MSPPIFGVISHNMCAKAPLSTTSPTPMEICPKLRQEQAILIQTHEERPILHFMSRAYDAKSIRRILIKEVAMTVMDLQVVESTRIPAGFAPSISLPLKDNHITLSILPTLTFGKTPSLTIVPWSVYIPSERRAKTFAFDEGITYIDFLNYYCAWDMGTPGRIDYTLHIFQKPLIYGFATLSTSQGQTSFFFARILSSEEMAALPPL